MIMQAISPIDLTKFKGSSSSVFTGRPQGEMARKSLNLDLKDKEFDTAYSLIIPEGTSSFNPSFYLGLLFKSIQFLGEKEFHKKYSFDIQVSNPNTKKVILKNLDDAMRNALNALNNRTGLSPFVS